MTAATRTGEGTLPVTLGRIRRRLLRCYHYRVVASPQRALLPGQPGRLPEQLGSAASRRPSMPGRGPQPPPRPSQPAAASGPGAARAWRVESAAAEAARRAPMEGRTAALVGPGGLPAVGPRDRPSAPFASL